MFMVWRPPTFLGLLELSGPCREDQFGPDCKFSIIGKNAVFKFLCLGARDRTQRQDSSAPRTFWAPLIAPALSISDPPPPGTHPCKTSAGRGVPWGEVDMPMAGLVCLLVVVTLHSHPSCPLCCPKVGGGLKGPSTFPKTVLRKPVHSQNLKKVNKIEPL